LCGNKYTRSNVIAHAGTGENNIFQQYSSFDIEFFFDVA